MRTRAIDFIEISKSYGEQEALNGVSFHVRENEIVSLLGCNGAGKTTALNILTGFLKPDSGKVLINNKDISTNLNWVKQNMGYLTSDMALYERFSVLESIIFLGQIRGLSASLLKQRMAYFWELFDIGSYEDKKFHELSSGQKQKSLITAAVIHDPAIMIFDEVTASLDVLTCKKIMDFLKFEKEKGKAILFSTHILSEAEYLSDRIIVVNEGKLIEENSARQMKERHNVSNLFEAFFKTIEEHSKDGKGAA
ncbi:ABC transporter ATP-binding protein [Bacteriovoracaceae bacterium]|nr:ABC transporter ATP-binding protein [Bacteriovoracaceae bacterium]